MALILRSSGAPLTNAQIDANMFLATTPISVAAGSVIPLDTISAGKQMVSQVLSAATTFSYSGAVDGGNCTFCLVADGVSGHVPNLAAFVNFNGYSYVNTAGAANIYSVSFLYGAALLSGFRGADTDSTVPSLVSATVADSDPLRINLVWSEAMNASVSAAAAFAISAGHTVTAHTYDTSTTSHLTITTPFVQGETARTLAYTQPGSNKMQDLAGNLVANITAASIVNNVGTPTLLSAIVSNSTPGRIDLTWSEAMNATISAVSAFAVNSGHPLTAHTPVDATHTYLTTSTAFVSGETKTLAYTQPGSSQMKDSAGGNLVATFTGFAITDNVGAAGSISVTSITIPASEDANNATWNDYHFYMGSGSDFTNEKTGAALLTVPTYGNAFMVTASYTTTAPVDIAAAAGDNEDGTFHFANWNAVKFTTAASASFWQITAPANANAGNKVRLYAAFMCQARDPGNIARVFTVTASLSDSSASPVVLSIDNTGSGTTDLYRCIDIIYKAASAGQTLTLRVDRPAGTDMEFQLFFCPQAALLHVA